MATNEHVYSSDKSSLRLTSRGLLELALKVEKIQYKLGLFLVGTDVANLTMSCKNLSKSCDLIWKGTTTAFRASVANEENEATGGFAKDQISQYWLGAGYYRIYYYSWKKNYQLFSSITHDKLVLKRFACKGSRDDSNSATHNAVMAVSNGITFGPSWYKKTWKEDLTPGRPPTEKWDNCYGPDRIMHYVNTGDKENARLFFQGFPYYVADNITSHDDHDAVLWISGLWKGLKDMSDPSAVKFTISCGLSHCCIRLLKLALTDQNWLQVGNNDFLPYYLCSILGSLVLERGGPKVPERLLAEGVLDVMVPVLRGAFTFFEVQMAERCIHHMVSESMKVALAVAKYPTAIESVANIGSTSFDRFLSQSIVQHGRQLPYQEDLISRGVTSFKATRPQMCGRATRIPSGCGAIISVCARAASSIGSFEDLRMFVQPGILDSFVERFFSNYPSERQTAATSLCRILSSIQLNQELVEEVILKYKLHKYFLAACTTPFRTENRMNMDEAFAGMNLPPLPKGAVLTHYLPSQVWAPAFYCVCSRYPHLHETLWDEGNIIQTLLPIVFSGQPQFPMPTTSAIDDKDFKLVIDDYDADNFPYFMPHMFTYSAEALVRICQTPSIYDKNESARYAVKISKQMLSSARYYEPLNNVSKVNSWIKDDNDLNPIDREFATYRRKKVSKEERTQLKKEFKDQRVASRKEWKLGTELEKNGDYAGAEVKYLNALFTSPVICFGGSTADRATFAASLARLRCDKLHNISQNQNSVSKPECLHKCLWAVSGAIESLGAFNSETLGQLEYEKVGKKHVRRRLEFLSRRINLIIEIFYHKLKPKNNWSKKLKSLGRDVGMAVDYPRVKNSSDKMNTWTKIVFSSPERLFTDGHTELPRSLLEKKYYELVTKEYQKYFRSVNYVAEREISGCRNLESENIYLVLLQSDVEKLFRYVQIWDFDDLELEASIERDENGKPIVTDEDIAECDNAVRAHRERLNQLVKDYIPQLKDVESGIVPSFEDLVKSSSLMLNSQFGSLLHIGENFFVLRATDRAFMKRIAMERESAAAGGSDTYADDSPLVYHGVGMKTLEDRSVHTWARAIYLSQVMSLEELGSADKPAQPGFSPRVEPDYNSDDDVNDIGTLFGYDETAKTRRMGFKKFGWYEGTQRFDPYLLNYAEHGLS